MLTALIVSLLFSATPDVWIESPLARVYPESFALATSPREIRIHAACGERESVQLCVRAKGEPLKDVSVEGQRIGKHVPAPTCYRVGYLRIDDSSPRAEREGILWPDPLLEFKSFEIKEDSTAAIWVTYEIPRDAVPGTYQGKLLLHAAKHLKRAIAVTIEIFPLVLPETPTLRTAFPLDRRAIRAVYGVPETDLDAWKPFYDALAHERIAYRVWDGGALVPIDRDGVADTASFKEHLDYAATSAHFNAVDIGAGPSGILPFPVPSATKLQDPLQFYLHDMCNWLDERGWLASGYVEVMPLPERAHWQLARDAYFRVQRNDKRIHRLLAGAGDPFFERYTDMWATPLRYFDPYCDALLRQGKSLLIKQSHEADAVSARSSGSLPGANKHTASRGKSLVRESRPEDAYDGCLFTYWVSANIPTPGEPQWLQINLKEPVTTSTIRIIWKSGLEAKDLEVERWLNDHFSHMSHIQWTPHPPSSPFEQSSLEGTLSEPETFQSIRFEFRSTFFKSPVGVTEIVLDETSETEPAGAIEPISTWLCAAEGDFPSFAVDAQPAEARLFPWVCWGHQAEGFMARTLNRWPASWVQESVAQPLIWHCKDAGLGFLFYPGRNGLLPSIRSEALRDGMEDYEYLAILNQAAQQGRVSSRDASALCARRLFAANVPPEQAAELGRMIEHDRVRMGWALTKRKGDVKR